VALREPACDFEGRHTAARAHLLARDGVLLSVQRSDCAGSIALSDHIPHVQ